MAKEEVHNYIRTLLALAVVIFAGGGYAMKINSNTSAIEKVDAEIGKVDDKTDANRELIHKNELVQTQINEKLNDIPEIKRDMEKLTEYIMQNWEFKDKGKN